MAFGMTIDELIANDTTGLLGIHPTWARVKLADVAEILNGAPFDSTLFDNAGPIPLIRIRDILSGTSETFYTGSYDKVFEVERGDLLIGMDGDFNSTFWQGKTALLNQRVCKIILFSNLYSKSFLGYGLPGYLSAINANTPSVTVKHLSSKTIGDIQLPLPPVAEQNRIVAKLEELLSDLDSGVSELKIAQKKLIQYRQSLLKSALEGTLTSDWRSRNPSVETGAQLLARILLERRARWEAKQLAKFEEQGKTPPKDWQSKYPAPTTPDTNHLPGLPLGWTWANVDQLSPDDLANGRSVQSAVTGAKVLRLTAVRDGSIDLNEAKTGNWTNDDARQFAVEKGDLLIVRGNGSRSLVGRAGLVGDVTEQVAYPDTMIRLRVLKAVVNTEWIGLLWNSQIVRTHLEQRARTSAGIYKISQPDIVSAVLPIPPLAEQEHILKIIAQQSDEANLTLNEVRSALKQSAAQRKNILKSAFSGQLVPQDPSDEPASALLARIREEREARAAVKKPRISKA